MDAWPLAKSTSTSWTPGLAWRAFLMDCSQRWQCIPSILMRTNWSPCVSAIGVAPPSSIFEQSICESGASDNKKLGGGVWASLTAGAATAATFLRLDAGGLEHVGGLWGGFSDKER